MTIDELIQQAYKLYMECKYQEAIQIYDKVLEQEPEHIRANLNKGISLAQLGRYVEAIVCYKTIINIISDQTLKAIVYSNMSIALYSLGKYEEVIECCDAVLKIEPENIIANINRCDSLCQLGRDEEVIEGYKTIIDKISDLTQKAITYFNMGVSLAQLGKYEDAITSYDKAIETDSKYVDAYLSKGILLAELGKHEDAIQCFDEILKIEPENILANLNKGISLTKLNKDMYAIEYFDKILEIDPKHILANLNKGILFSKLDRYVEAIEYYDIIINNIENSKDKALAYLNKGITLTNSGKYEDAIKCFDKILKIEPENILANLNKGISLTKLNKDMYAIEYFDKILEIDPKHILANLNKGISLVKLRYYKDSIEYFDKILEIDSKHILANLNKGITLAQLNMENDAKACWDIIINNKTLDELHKVDAYLNKSILYFKLAKYKEAVEILNIVIEIGTKNKESYYLLSICYDKLGKSDEAKEYLDKFKQLDPNNPIFVDKEKLEENIEKSINMTKHFDKERKFYKCISWIFFSLGVALLLFILGCNIFNYFKKLVPYKEVYVYLLPVITLEIILFLIYQKADRLYHWYRHKCAVANSLSFYLADKQEKFNKVQQFSELYIKFELSQMEKLYLPPLFVSKNEFEVGKNGFKAKMPN